MRVSKVFIVSCVLFSMGAACASPKNINHIKWMQPMEKPEENSNTNTLAEEGIFKAQNSCNPMIDPRCNR